MSEEKRNSRMAGLYRLPREERVRWAAEWSGQDLTAVTELLECGGLNPDDADLLSENVLGIYSLPFSVAPNFLVNGKDILVPMVTEEPSVVAAASHAARLVRDGGGFDVEVCPPLMAAQIQLFHDNIDAAAQKIAEQKQEILDIAREVDPTLISLGGGPVDLEIRSFGTDMSEEPFLVLHLHVDVRDAMGANIVNSMAEVLAEPLQSRCGGKVGLRILTNLCDRRMVKAKAEIPLSSLKSEAFTPEEVRDGILRAARFADIDPYRAATHNKGIMNGIDAVMLATGNDFRAVEAGAHAFAARHGRYRSFSQFSLGQSGNLKGKLEIPLAVGIVGGAAKAHPLARLALELLGVQNAADLAAAAAAAGLASNIAALKALATEGIQKGHMRLHRRRGGLER